MLEKIPDAFNDATNVTRSHIEATNVPAKVHISQTPATTTAPRAKRGRPQGSKDNHPRQRKLPTNNTKLPAPIPAATYNIVNENTSDQVSTDNEEISITYKHTGNIYQRQELKLNERFAYAVIQDITNAIPDPHTIKEAQKQAYWPQWQAAINTKMDALIKRQVFGPFKNATADTDYTDSRFTFLKKRNEKGEIVRYQARLVAKGYTQISGRDYDLTYSPVMDATTYRYLISFSVYNRLINNLMDVVTAYLYGTLDTEIYMNAPLELIQRVRQHVQGETSQNLNSKIKESIRQIIPDAQTKTLLMQGGNTQDKHKRIPGTRRKSQTQLVVRVLAR